MSYRGKLLVRDDGVEPPTTVESGRDSTTELITQIVVPQVGLEPTRTRHWFLRPAWLPLHHRGMFWWKR